MKKLKEKYKCRLIRLSYFAQLKAKKNKKNFGPKESKFVSPNEVIKAPYIIDLGDNAVELVKTMRAVSRRVLGMNRPVKINFKDTKQFYVTGAIYLYAELNRIIDSSKLQNL